MSNPPRRACEIRIKIAGDTYDDLMKALRQCYLDLDDERHRGRPVELCYGDKSYSFVAYGDQQDISPAEYAAAVDKYVRDRVEKVNGATERAARETLVPR